MKREKVGGGRGEFNFYFKNQGVALVAYYIKVMSKSQRHYVRCEISTYMCPSITTLGSGTSACLIGMESEAAMATMVAAALSPLFRS